MLALIADRDACQGYGNCLTSAPDIYDIDDDGKVVLLIDTVEDTERQRVDEATRSCPVNALAVEEM